ncbi:MAG TPA: DinB family protein [Gemmatimonadaceae bacterium]|nr:DinB family protein [Gemmatimonadaceae bacterium]
MFDTGEPARGAEIARALLALHVESTAYLDGLPTAEFFETQVTKWSPAEHARHLHKSVRPLVKALALPRILLRLRFGAHRGASRKFSEVRDAYRARLALGYGANPYAPSPRDVPADADAWRRDIMRRWTASVDELGSAIGRWNERALDRYRLPHPLLGALSVREMLLFTLYHNAHHVRLVAARRSARVLDEPRRRQAQGWTSSKE